MKTIRKNSAIIFLALIVCAVSMVHAEDGSRSKSFNVSKGGTLEVNTSVGNIRISTWEKNEVYVNVDGLDDDELEHVKMTQSGNTVRVIYRSRWSSWSGNVEFSVSVPAQFNLDISTSGGDLEVRGSITGKIDGSTSGGSIKLGNAFGGPVEMTTSGGNITVGKIEGEDVLKTAGGDIEVGSVNGSLNVNTSGGDIHVESITKSLNAHTSGGDISIGDVGGEAQVSTSGGNINVGKVSGKASLNTAGGDIELKGASGRVTAKTSGGDIHLQNITGTIEGKTSGGEIEAELIPSGKGNSRLSSSGGDIRLYVSENSKATIEATIRLNGWGWGSYKSHYVVKSEFPKESYDTDEDAGEIHAVYKLNGGGDMIELSTVNSNIEIHKLR